MTVTDLDDPELPYAPEDDSFAAKVRNRGADRAGKPKKVHPPKSTTRSVVEWVAVVAGALVVAFVIRTFLFGAYVIPSGSMEPTLEFEPSRDRVLVNKLAYKFHDIRRGDVIVFDRPPGETDPSIDVLIKRVIALPGESVYMDPTTGQITINGQLLDEPYLNVDECTARGDWGKQMEAAVTVPDGQIWVMGDNRCNSSDSRVFGPIDEGSVIGRAFVRVWPLNHLGWL